MKSIYSLLSAFIIIAGFAGTAANAQQSGSQTIQPGSFIRGFSGNYFKLRQAGGIWRDGNNPGGLSDYFLINESRISSSYSLVSGDFRRPQEPESAGNYSLSAEGNAKAFQWITYGKFEYNRRSLNNVRWADVSDPYSGSPFIWADTTGGDWTNNEVAITASLGSPLLFNLIHIGAGVDYAVGEGARRNDTRPYFHNMNLAVRPGIIIKPFENHTVGFNMSFGWFREDDEVGYYSNEYALLYNIRGLTTYDKTQLVSAERADKRASYGFGLQYSLKAGSYFITAVYNNLSRKDSVLDGIAYPKFRGRFDQAVNSAKLVVNKKLEESDLEISAQFSSTEGKGFDPVFRAVNQKDELTEMGLSGEWWNGINKFDSNLYLTLSGSVLDLSRKDIIAENSWKSSLLRVSVGGGSNRYISETVRLFGFAFFSKSFVLDDKYSWGAPSKITYVITRPDYLISSADSYTVSVLAGSEFQLGFLTSGIFQVTAELCYTGTSLKNDNGSPLGNRSAMKLGINFMY